MHLWESSCLFSFIAESCLIESRSQNQCGHTRGSRPPSVGPTEAYFGIPGGVVGSGEWPEGVGVAQHSKDEANLPGLLHKTSGFWAETCHDQICFLNMFLGQE